MLYQSNQLESFKFHIFDNKTVLNIKKKEIKKEKEKTERNCFLF